MSEPQNGRNGSVVGIAGRIAASLPAQFLALVLINVIVLWLLFEHQSNLSEARERVLIELIKTCSAH